MEIMKDYNLIFDEHSIYKVRDNGTVEHVMMDWEAPVMYKHAMMVSYPGADVLEIGFGMGISADYIQQNRPNSHTIVEIHPLIAQKAREWAKDKNYVRIIEGDWIDVIDEIIKIKYNGIFFDSHADENKAKFKELVVDKCIKSGGIFSYFNLKGRDIYGFGDKLMINHISNDVRIPQDCEYHKYPHYCVPYVIYPGPL